MTTPKKRPRKLAKAEKLVQEAKILFSAQLLIELPLSEMMKERIQRFLKDSEI